MATFKISLNVLENIFDYWTAGVVFHLNVRFKLKNNNTKNTFYPINKSMELRIKHVKEIAGNDTFIQKCVLNFSGSLF